MLLPRLDFVGALSHCLVMVATQALRAMQGGVSDASSEAKPARRAYFVDILRLIASFQMVNGHTLDAVLQDGARGGPSWGTYLWFRGLVSVAFMFVAGFAFHLATLARFERHRRSSSEIRRRFRRGFDLILIGYLLRVPYDYLWRPQEIPSELIDALFRCNVLQCIGVTLIVLETLTIVARSPRQVALAAGLLAALLAWLAPFTDQLDPHGPWQILLNYVSHGAGSMFPVLPWGAFMLAGTAIGFWAMPQGAHTSSSVTIARLAIVAVVFWGLREVIAERFVDAPISINAQPEFILERLLAVTFLTAALAVVSRGISSFPRVLKILSGETLFLYVFHLVVIFSLPFGVSASIGRSLSLPQSLGVSALMVAITVAAGLVWHRFKAIRMRQTMRATS